MFKCKFCLKDKTNDVMSTAHKNMCAPCYNSITRYRRLVLGGVKKPEDLEFIKRFELQCRHNTAVKEYVPKIYSRGVERTISRCPSCGGLNKRASAYNASICVDCANLENRYRSLLYRLASKGLKCTSVVTDRRTEDSIITLHKYEQEYMDRHKRGYLTPKAFRDKFNL